MQTRVQMVKTSPKWISKIWPSKAKNVDESDFDDKTRPALPKSAENNENLISEVEIFLSFFWHRKIESCKYSEQRIAEVSRQSELTSFYKPTFEVRCRRAATYVLLTPPTSY